MTSGRLVSIHLGAGPAGPLQSVDSVEAVPGRGLRGDRYFNGTGTWSGHPDPTGKQVTLVDQAVVAEQLDAGFVATSRGTRRNLTTAGIDLAGLAGRRFRIGEVLLVGVRPAEPCVHLETLAAPGLRRALRGRGGLRSDVLSGGWITVGDPIEVAHHAGEWCPTPVMGELPI